MTRLINYLQNRSAWRELLLVLFIAGITAAPFWITVVPPSTDLPQHLAQAFMLEQVLSGQRPELMVTPWYYPNTLVYAVIYPFWKLTDPITAGRLSISALSACWVAASYFLAKHYGRPVANWLIGVPLVFNFTFTWGLLNFIVGWPVFCLFLIAASTQSSRRQMLSMAFIAMLLYYAHAFWFLAANAWLAARFLDRQKTPLPYSAAMAPAWLCALFWYPQLAKQRLASGVDIGADWDVTPTARLGLDYVSNAAFGRIFGEIETVFMLCIYAWILIAFITNRNELAKKIDKNLLLAALVLLLAYWILPWRYMNTIFMNQRWLPCAFVLLLLALPSPNLNPRLSILFATSFTFIFSAASVKAFKGWETEQLNGFMSAISKIEREDRVLGLNLMGGSFNIKGRPDLQLFAYAQVLRGSDIHFTFTEHYSGVVQYRQPRERNSARSLVTSPGLVRREHLADFDKILIHADNSMHEIIQRKLGIKPISAHEAPWRTYRTERQDKFSAITSLQ